VSTVSVVSPVAHARTSESSEVRSKLLGLQVLRFVAAFAVVLFHIGSGYQIRWDYQTNIFSLGAAGVDIFFVISGFIIAYTTDPAKGAWHFCKRRLFRIVPLYWILTLGVTAIALIRPDLLNSTQVSGETLLKSLFFIPFEKANGTIQPILFLGWTLNYEMFFYAVYALCLVLGLRGPLAPALLIVMLVTAGQFIEIDHVLWRFYTNPLMLEFVFGICLYLIYVRWPALFVRRGILIAIFAAILAARQLMPDLPWIIASGIPAAGLAALALSWNPKHTPLVAMLVLFGDASYSLYLSHPYIIQALSRFLPDEPSLWPQIVIGAIACVVSILASIVLYKAIERPSQQLLDGWMRGKERS
jgi:peptidoglycan/LPS O-acetylase OafA/YrhL